MDDDKDTLILSDRDRDRVLHDLNNPSAPNKEVLERVGKIKSYCDENGDIIYLVPNNLITFPTINNKGA